MSITLLLQEMFDGLELDLRVVDDVPKWMDGWMGGWIDGWMNE